MATSTRMPRASGAVMAGAPLLLGLAPLLHAAELRALVGQGSFSGRLLLVAVAALVTLGGGWALHRDPGRGRNAVLGGLALASLATLVAPEPEPLVALAAGSLTLLALHALWPLVEAPDEAARPRSAVAAARSACTVAISACVAWLLLGWGTQPFLVAVVAPSALLASLLAVAAAWRARSAHPTWTFPLLLLVSVGAVTLALLGWPNPTRLLGAVAFVPAASLLLLQPERGRWRTVRAVAEAVLAHPARTLVVTFLGLSGIGALLLLLPGVATSTVSPIDAAFTATSAVCVTGLAVLDTGSELTAGGQGLLLLLIQVGGLGIMSFSTVAFAALGRRLSLRQEAAMAELFSGSRSDLYRAVQRLLVLTFAVEAVGASVLTAAFVAEGEGTASAVWRGVFTAVSAFCNAGFALQADSLVPYASNPVVLHTVALLIIVGGLGPFVIADLPRLFRRRPARLQTKIVLGSTAALLLLGALIVGGLEYNGAFRHLDPVDRLHGAWFQSVTLRTAGFNSVDFTALGAGTQWIMCAFMVIGGSPGGTAGGIKTTTAFVLIVAVAGAMRGRWEAVALGRRIADRTVLKAAAIVTIALAFIVFGVTAIVVTQALPLGPALFEVISALGTVGLTVGATAALDDVGKIIVMVFMFVGRVGPLTLFLFLRGREVEAPWRLPEENVDVG